MTKIEGRKDDGSKIDTTLLFDDLPNALYAVAEVMQWACTDKKPVPYGRSSWKGVALQRYRAALTRHILDAAQKAQENGQPIETQLDDESGLLHLAHQAASVLFQLELVLQHKDK